MAPPNNLNVPAPNTPYFTPAQIPPAGTAADPQPDERPIPSLFQPFKIRGVEFQNRIFLSPLCQYSADDGKLTPWHMAHLGGILTRGPSLIIVEATAILPEGRITPQDSGLWSDSQIESHTNVVQFAHSQNQRIAIQLNHAGRKASTIAPWITGDETASAEVGGWPDDVWAPSTLPFDKTYPTPKELTKAGIEEVKQAFVDAAKRAVKAGYDVIEIHNAHGYLLDEFISPAVNKRTDEYGGSFENRIRLSLEVVDGVREVIPKDMPLFLRISASDWLESYLNEPSWRSEDTVRFAPILYKHGIDFLDVSSGGNNSRQKIIIAAEHPAYQAHFAEAVKKTLNLPPIPSGATAEHLVVGSVGGIRDGKTAQGVLDKGQADVVLLGRAFMKNPGAVWQFAEDLASPEELAKYQENIRLYGPKGARGLGVRIRLPNQIRWAFHGRGVKSHPPKEGDKTAKKVIAPEANTEAPAVPEKNGGVSECERLGFNAANTGSIRMRQ